MAMRFALRLWPSAPQYFCVCRSRTRPTPASWRREASSFFRKTAGVPFSPRLRPSLTNGAEAIHVAFWGR